MFAVIEFDDQVHLFFNPFQRGSFTLSTSNVLSRSELGETLERAVIGDIRSIGRLERFSNCVAELHKEIQLGYSVQ